MIAEFFHSWSLHNMQSDEGCFSENLNLMLLLPYEQARWCCTSISVDPPLMKRTDFKVDREWCEYPPMKGSSYTQWFATQSWLWSKRSYPA